MISGSFSAVQAQCLPHDYYGQVSVFADLVFRPVSTGCFSGGFYIHPDLPLTTDDFFWTDVDSGLTVLLSGYIYNRHEITKITGTDGQVPDPGLIVRLFIEEGPAFVSRLNGDFAFAIIDQKQREAWLFRDHVGIRPLAFAIEGEKLFFSTDILSLSSSLCEGEGADTIYLTGHFRYIDFRTPPCRKVKKLLPGHYLHFRGGMARVSRYWEPEDIRQDKSLTHETMLAELKTLLRDAVRIRCDRRFTAGAHVSSGLDSGVVAALARQECASQKDFCGFSWSPGSYQYGGPGYDERDLVRKLCAQHNIHPHFLTLDTEGFMEMVSRFHVNHGFFWEEALLGQAAAEGVNLLFSGWGGDEFVSTAAPSTEADLLRGLKLRLFFRRNELRKPRKFLKNMVRYILMPALCIHERGTAKSFRDEARYLRPPWQKSDRKAVKQFYFHTSRRGHHLGMLKFYHLQDRCEKWFTMGYSRGIEYRYPLLDRRIIEFMLKVPSELLCATDYYRPLLREAGKGLLPEEVRLNTSKSDPVYRDQMNDLLKDAALAFMGEAGSWKDNPDLGFIDFDRLNSDIEMYRRGDRTADDDRLFRGIVWIKAMDSFTKDYRSAGLKINRAG